MSGLAAVLTGHYARNIDRLEVSQSQRPEAAEIIVVPSGIRGSCEAAAASVVGQDNPVVTQRGDDDRGLRTCFGTGGIGYGHFQSVYLTRGLRHRATGGGRGLREHGARGNCFSAGSGAGARTSRFRRWPHPVV